MGFGGTAAGVLFPALFGAWIPHAHLAYAQEVIPATSQPKAGGGESVSQEVLAAYERRSGHRIYPEIQCSLSDSSGKTIPSRLSSETLKKIAAAGAGGYKTKILYDPASRNTIVLIGETHVKGPWAPEAGKRILEDFPLRAFEGILYPEEMKALSGPAQWIANLSAKSGVSIILDATRTSQVLKCDQPIDPSALELGKFFSVMLECGKFSDIPEGVCGMFSMNSPACEDFINTRRNQRMTNNLVSLLSKTRQDGTVLGLVGENHMPGLEKNLVGRGFKILGPCQGPR